MTLEELANRLDDAVNALERIAELLALLLDGERSVGVRNVDAP